MCEKGDTGTVLLMHKKHLQPALTIATYAYGAGIGLLLVVSLVTHRFLTEQQLVSSGVAAYILAAYILLAIGYTILVVLPTAPKKYLLGLSIAMVVLATSVWPFITLDVAGYLNGAKDIVAYGINPMRQAFAAAPQNPWAAVIAPTYWYALPAPYGPIFFMLIAPLGLISHLAVAVYALKVLFLVMWLGVVYLIWTQLLRARNDWHRLLLIVLNPFVILFGLVDAHNDVVPLFFTLLGLLFIRNSMTKSYYFWMLAVLSKISSIVVWPVGWFDRGRIRLDRIVGSVVGGVALFVIINHYFGHSVSSFLASYVLMGKQCLYACSPIRTALVKLHIPTLAVAGILWIIIMRKYLYTTYEPYRFTVWSYLILIGVATSWFAPWYLIIPTVFALTINDQKYTRLAWALTILGLIVAAAAFF